MVKKWLKKTLGVAVGVQAGFALLGGNLHTFAEGATEITESTDKLEASKEYSISSVESFLKFRDLINNGDVEGELKVEESGTTDTRATIKLTKDIDLTESGTYTNGYCDKPIYKDGKVVGWHTVKHVNGDGSVEWEIKQPDTTGMVKITESTTFESGERYVIENEEEYNNFVRYLGNSVPAGVKVILIGSVQGNEFVEPVRDGEGNILSGWYETESSEYGHFGSWEKTGNGGGGATHL